MIDEPKTQAELEYNSRKWALRMEMYENLCKREFQLVYFANFSYDEIDQLTPTERDMVYGFLVEQKEAEKKAQEDNLQKIKQQKSSKRSGRRR